MSRWLGGTVVVAALLAVAASPAAAPAAVSLAPSGNEPFPKRTFRLTLPEQRALTPGDVRVYENGELIRGAELVAAGATHASFGTVLVIDASLSMRGAPINEAVAAARDLARLRTGSQRLGVVTFNDAPRVVLDMTDDEAKIAGALASPPPLAPQTHIFDAVALGLQALKQQRIVAGTLVVLSDGADTGSALTVAAAARQARAAGVRVFSIGLRSNAFNQSDLRALAAGGAGGGRYAAAGSVKDLRPIFQAIGAELATEYLVRYRSNEPRGREVRVAVRVPGVEELATARYVVPGDANFVLVEDTFWTSSIGVLLTTLLFGLLLSISLAFMLVRRLRKPGVRERIDYFTDSYDAGSVEEQAIRGELLSGRVQGSAERSLERTKWWAAFKEQVEIADIKTDPARIVFVSGGVSLVAAWILARATGSIIPVLVIAVVVPLAVRAYVRMKLERQRRLFADQLPDMLQGIASALRAGHALVGALSMIVDGAPEPSRREFRRVVADERLGIPLEEGLESMRQRMNNRDVQQVALVAQLQRETGANAAEVLDRVTSTVRQRGELRRMVRGLTAQGRLSRTVVTALPIALLLFISLLNPGYTEPLFTTTTGRVLLAVGAVMLTCGSLIIKKIVDFKV